MLMLPFANMSGAALHLSYESCRHLKHCPQSWSLMTARGSLAMHGKCTTIGCMPKGFQISLKKASPPPKKKKKKKVLAACINLSFSRILIRAAGGRARGFRVGRPEAHALVLGGNMWQRQSHRSKCSQLINWKLAGLEAKHV